MSSSSSGNPSDTSFLNEHPVGSTQSSSVLSAQSLATSTPSVVPTLPCAANWPGDLPAQLECWTHMRNLCSVEISQLLTQSVPSIISTSTVTPSAMSMMSPQVSFPVASAGNPSSSSSGYNSSSNHSSWVVQRVLQLNHTRGQLDAWITAANRHLLLQQQQREQQQREQRLEQMAHTYHHLYVQQVEVVTQWYWQNDQNQWIPYTGLSQSIEQQYQRWRPQRQAEYSKFRVAISAIPERTYVINFPSMTQKRLPAGDATDNTPSSASSVPSSASSAPLYRKRLVRRKSKTITTFNMKWPPHWLWVPDLPHLTSTLMEINRVVPETPLPQPISGASVEPPSKRTRRQLSPLSSATVNSHAAANSTNGASCEHDFGGRLLQPPPLAIPRSFTEHVAVLVDLPPTSKQYQSYSGSFMHSIHEPIYKAFASGVQGTPSYKPPDFLTPGYEYVVITQILQVQHAYRWRSYEELRCRIQDEVDPLEVFKVERTSLFHGTSWSAVNSIVQNGLDVSMNRHGVIGRLWGNGVYVTPISSFATHYAYSRGSNDVGEYVVLICRAIVGMSEIGSPGKLMPSQIPCARGKRYHSTHDHPVSPFQYCVWNSVQVYVDAIVRFRCKKRATPLSSVSAAASSPVSSVSAAASSAVIPPPPLSYGVSVSSSAAIASPPSSALVSNSAALTSASIASTMSVGFASASGAPASSSTRSHML